MDFENEIAWVDVTGATFTEWATVRGAIAHCIRRTINSAETGARVYPHWIYEIDAASLLGKVTAPMRATSGTAAGTVRAWSIGVSSAVREKNQLGVSPTIGSGGAIFTWILTLDVWAFFENDGTGEAQRVAENESRLVSASLERNALPIIQSIPLLSQLTALEFTVSSSPFSDGQNIIVAAGTMQARVNESLGI